MGQGTTATLGGAEEVVGGLRIWGASVRLPPLPPSATCRGAEVVAWIGEEEGAGAATCHSTT